MNQADILLLKALWKDRKFTGPIYWRQNKAGQIYEVARFINNCAQLTAPSKHHVLRELPLDQTKLKQFFYIFSIPDMLKPD